MKLYLIGCYNRQSGENIVHVIHANDPLSATAVLLGELVYSSSPKFSMRITDFKEQARTISKYFRVTNYEDLLSGEVNTSIGVNRGFKNAAVLAIYSPRVDKNLLVEFDNTRYAEAVPIFIQQLQEALDDYEMMRNITRKLREHYQNNLTLRNVYSILKQEGFILSETKSLKLGKIKEDI